MRCFFAGQTFANLLEVQGFASRANKQFPVTDCRLLIDVSLTLVTTDRSAVEHFSKRLPFAHALPPNWSAPLNGSREFETFQACFLDRPLAPPIYPVIPGHRMIAGKCSRKVAPESMGWMYAKRPRFASSNEVPTRRLDAASWSALLGAYRMEEAKRGRSLTARKRQSGDASLTVPAGQGSESPIPCVRTTGSRN
jgi:hypothetical protein